MSSGFYKWVQDRRDVKATAAECSAEIKDKCPYHGTGTAGKQDLKDPNAAAPKKTEHDFRVGKDGTEVPTNAAFREAFEKLDPSHRIYAVSDIHSTDIEDLAIDGHGIVIIGGDFLGRANEKSGDKYDTMPGAEKVDYARKWIDETFIPWCERNADKQFVVIPGNHDKYFQYGDQSSIKWPKNVHFLVDKAVTVNGLRMYGTPWCYHNLNGAYEIGHAELDKMFAKIPKNLDVLISHSPPSVDGSDIDFDPGWFGHFGSRELEKAIREKQPKLVLCGHVHTGDHRPIKIGDSTVVNVAKIGIDRAVAGFAGRQIGFSGEGDRANGGAKFLLDETDGAQISKTAYAVPGNKIKGQVWIENGEINPKSAYVAVKEAAKAINHAVDRGHFRPQANALGVFWYAKPFIDRMPKGAVGDYLRKVAKEIEDSRNGGYRKAISNVQMPQDAHSQSANAAAGDAVSELCEINAAIVAAAKSINYHADVVGDFKPNPAKMQAAFKAMDRYAALCKNGGVKSLGAEDAKRASMLVAPMNMILSSRRGGYRSSVGKVQQLFCNVG